MLQPAPALNLARSSADPHRTAPDAALVTHIVEHHREYARRALPYIVPLLARAAGFHGKRNGKLKALCDAGQELAETVEAHLEEEEREFLPALRAGVARGEVLRRELQEMDRYHRDVELLLGLVRTLADGYSAPDWGDASYRALMEELEALEEELREQMHLESYVVAPRLASRT